MSRCNSVELTYYQRNRDVTPNRAKDCHDNDKERLRGRARDKRRNLSEEEKEEKNKRIYCGIWKKQIPQYI